MATYAEIQAQIEELTRQAAEVRIPAKLDTDSGSNWTVIPRQTGQLVRGNLDSRSVATRGF